MTPSDHDELRTERVMLRPLSRELAEDVVAGRRRPEWAPGFPQSGDRTVARLRLRGAPLDGSDEVSEARFGAYEVWTLVGECIGTAGFHQAPIDGEVEIGYGIAPTHQDRGLATEAVTALLALARRHGIRRVVAHAAAHNVASLRLLARLGFVAVEGADDSGSEEIALALELSPGGEAARAEMCRPGSG